MTGMLRPYKSKRTVFARAEYSKWGGGKVLIFEF
jgi:hypothetical protein